MSWVNISGLVSMNVYFDQNSRHRLCVLGSLECVVCFYNKHRNFTKKPFTYLKLRTYVQCPNVFCQKCSLKLKIPRYTTYILLSKSPLL